MFARALALTVAVAGCASSPTPAAGPQAAAPPPPSAVAAPVHSSAPDAAAPGEDVAPHDRIEAFAKKARAAYMLGDDSKTDVKTSKKGDFSLVVAEPRLEEGNPNTYDVLALVLTAHGEREITVGHGVTEDLADFDGDGAPELVLQYQQYSQLKSWSWVTVVADRPGGPEELAITAKAGYAGWKSARFQTMNGKPSIVAVTDPTSTMNGPDAPDTRGVAEQVVIQWTGKALAEVSRTPAAR